MSEAEEDYTESEELFREGETIVYHTMTVHIPKASLFAGYFVFLALIASLLASALTPGSAVNLRSPAVEAALDDFVDYFGQNSQFSRKQFSFSIASVGYPPVTELGGPVNLSDETALLVEGIAPSLLKGTTRSYYTGRGWTYAEDPSSYRFDSLLWSAKKAEIFGLDFPKDEYNPQPGLLYRNTQLTITPYLNLYTLFAPTRPYQIHGSEKNFVPYFNDAGELFPKRRMSFMNPYTVEAYQFGRVSPRVADYLHLLEETIPPDSPEKKAEINRLYLQLPELLPESVHTFGRSLANSASDNSRIYRALAIRDYLMSTFTYTLTPVEVPEGRDFVEFFLETKEGYCTYYATAMVVLARTAGIPARYAEGFLLTNAPHEDNRYTATGKNAHAWAELYFEGIGWIPFDATPIAETPNDQESPGSVQTPEGELPPPSPSPPPLGFPIEPVAEPRPLWQFFAFLFGLLVLLNLLFLSIHRVRYSKRRLVAKFGKSGAAKIYWTGLLDLIAHQDKMFKHRPGESSTHLADRIGNLVELRSTSFKQLVHIAMRIYYAETVPTDADLELLFRAFREAEARWMRILTPPVFAVRRILFPRKNGFRKISSDGNLFAQSASKKVNP